MSTLSSQYKFLNIVEPEEHRGKMTSKNLNKYIENFIKPALFKNLALVETRKAIPLNSETIESLKTYLKSE